MSLGSGKVAYDFRSESGDNAVIAIRAREIYEARGGAHGQDLDDWLQAEREIDADLEERTLEADEDDES